MPGLLDLNTLDHATLSNMRDKVVPGSPEDQALAPYEHQAFARQWTQDNPWLAVPSLAIASPLYYLAKQRPFVAAGQAMGLVGPGATPASLDQLTKSYSGIGQGLAANLQGLLSN